MKLDIHIKSIKNFRCSHCGSFHVTYFAGRPLSPKQEFVEVYECHACGERSEFYEDGGVYHYNTNDPYYDKSLSPYKKVEE